MSFLYFMLIFGTYFSKTITGNDVRGPVGARMCEELCSKFGRCLYPVFCAQHLSCILRETKFHATLVSLNSSKRELICKVKRKQDTRLILSHTGIQICVFSGTRKMNTMKPARGKFHIKVPPGLDRIKCTVNSMQESSKHSNIVFLLLKCRPDMSKCFVLLGYLNVSTRELSNRTLDLCERQEYNRQIFSGPCVNSKGRCLYSTNCGYNFLLTIYSEPDLSMTRIIKDVTIRNFGEHMDNSVCGLLRTTSIYCLTGRRLTILTLFRQPGHTRFELKTTKSRLNQVGLGSVRDLAITGREDVGEYVVVNNSHINLLLFDWKRLRVQVKWSVNKTAVWRSVASIAGSVLFSGIQLHHPFLICSLHSLQTDLENYLNMTVK